MNNFPWADIHELLLPDLLHQLIKGCFKDHLVMWIVTYIENSNSDTWTKQILNDIDHRWVSIANSGQQTLTLVSKSISLAWVLETFIRDVASNSGQVMTPRPWWRFVSNTGSYNSTPLSSWQIYLPAIEEYVPDNMIKALCTFLEFCYLAHHNIHNRKSLDRMDKALQSYHHYHKIFLATGVRMGFNLPCQHALIHYIRAIQLFGAPNGLCSSIMESKHIKAMKGSSAINTPTSSEWPGMISRDEACLKAHAYCGS